MTILRWLGNDRRTKERTTDSGGDVPVSQNHPADTVPLSSEPSDTCLQAWERMAIRTFGSGTVDSRAHEAPVGVVKEAWH